MSGESLRHREKVMPQRFAIAISPWVAPILALVGIPRGQAWVALDAERLQVHFGPWFNETFPLSAIARADRGRIGLWWAPGAHLDGRGTVGLTGRYGEGVELRFAAPQRVRLLVPLRCSQLVLSLADPDAFLAALGQWRTGPDATASA